ncbi:MAG: hypothetical protein IJC39_03605 [Firmicutes bacterium]|nr:hypothetical protein [Bacillota bacterium]
MKKFMMITLLIFILGASGCNSKTYHEPVYSFPEPTVQIHVSHISQGKETKFTIGPETYDPDNTSVIPVMEWFYSLELKECKEPEVVEGNELYSFSVDGKPAFSYDHRGNEAFVIVNNIWYRVENQTPPPHPPLGECLELTDIEHSGNTFEVMEYTVAEIGRGTLKTAIELSPEDAETLTSIIEDGNWNACDGNTVDYESDCAINLKGILIYYHSGCGRFNKYKLPDMLPYSSKEPDIDIKTMLLTETEKIAVNSILRKYITLGVDIEPME